MQVSSNPKKSFIGLCSYTNGDNVKNNNNSHNININDKISNDNK